MRLSRRFTLAFIGVGLIPLFALTWFAYQFTSRVLTEQVEEQLESLARVQRNRVGLLFELKRDQLSLISSRTQLRVCLSDYLDSPDPMLVEQMVRILHDARGESGDLLSVVTVDGEVVASTGEAWLSEDVPASPELFKEAVRNQVFDELYLDERDRATLDMYGPLFDDEGNVLGVTWVRTRLHELSTIAGDFTGLGSTGETLLVRRDAKGKDVFLTPLRFEVSPDEDAGASILEQTSANEKLVLDYRGENTIYATDYSPDLECGVVVKIDQAEALQPVSEFAVTAGLTAFFTAIVVVLLGLLISRSITGPLQSLTDAAEHFVDGDLSKHMPSTNQEEVSRLGEALVGMATRLVNARKELETEAIFRRSVVDSALDAVISVDSEGRVKLWNPQAELMFGVDESAALEQSIDGLVSPIDPELSLRRQMEQFIQDQDASSFGDPLECQLRRQDGSVFDVEIAISPMRIDDKDRFGVFIHEMTGKKEAERKLQKAINELRRKNEEIRHLLYTVSHDLKAPLVTCKGFIDVMKDDLLRGDVDELNDSMNRIQKAAARMDKLIDDLLQISRIGTIDMHKEWIDVPALIAGIIDEWQMRIEAAQVEIVVSPDMPPLWADRTQASTVFENLLANAMKYGCSHASPRIEIGGEQVQGESRFFVGDNGRGIAPEFHEKIFRLFQRLESNQPGTGVGLAAVARILEVHGGNAWVDSKLHGGSVFWVAFPTPAEEDPLSVALARDHQS